jgi:hypothetical protein
VSALAARPGVATTFLRWTFTRAMFHKGYVLVSGLSVIWVNRRTTSEVRATVRSFLSQAECAGEIASGFPLAVVAQAAGIPAGAHDLRRPHHLRWRHGGQVTGGPVTRRRSPLTLVFASSAIQSKGVSMSRETAPAGGTPFGAPGDRPVVDTSVAHSARVHDF